MFADTQKTAHRSIFGWRGAHSGGSLNPANKTIMASSSGGGGILKDCTHPNFNETLKSHNNVTFKLVKTGKWFLQKIIQISFIGERELKLTLF